MTADHVGPTLGFTDEDSDRMQDAIRHELAHMPNLSRQAAFWLRATALGSLAWKANHVTLTDQDLAHVDYLVWSELLSVLDSWFPLRAVTGG